MSVVILRSCAGIKYRGRVLYRDDKAIDVTDVTFTDSHKLFCQFHVLTKRLKCLSVWQAEHLTSLGAHSPHLVH